MAELYLTITSNHLYLPPNGKGNPRKIPVRLKYVSEAHHFRERNLTLLNLLRQRLNEIQMQSSNYINLIAQNSATIIQSISNTT